VRAAFAFADFNFDDMLTCVEVQYHTGDKKVSHLPSRDGYGHKHTHTTRLYILKYIRAW